MRLIDLEKDAFTFKREVLTAIVGGQDGNNCESTAGSATTTTAAAAVSTSIIKSERIIRYFQRKTIQLDSAKDKLKLQQRVQKNRLQKIETKLKQREESGRNFHYIDFHQLQTENKRFKAELNNEKDKILNVKIVVEKSEKRLIGLNTILKEHEDERIKAEKSLGLRKRHFQRLQDKVQRNKDTIQCIKTDQQRANDENSDVSIHAKDVDVMNIVHQQTKIFELKSLIKTWTRKVEIAQLARKNRKIAC